MCQKYLFWAFETSMGGKSKVVIFPFSLLPKVLVLHPCFCVTVLKNHFLGLSKTIQTFTQLILELIS